MPAVSRESLRPHLAALVNERLPADALTVYYALYHPAERVQLFSQGAEGLLLRARTGMDLFRPLVTFRARTAAMAGELLREGLPPYQPVYLMVPELLANWANQYLDVTEAEIHRVYCLNLNRYERILNVLVTQSTAPDGSPRCEIRSGDRPGAVAGVNWQSPRFAEVYVHTDFAVRGRGWGKAVVAALVDQLLQSGRTPLYVVAETNEYSVRLAEAVGFDDTGAREYVGQAVLKTAPAPEAA